MGKNSGESYTNLVKQYNTMVIESIGKDLDEKYRPDWIHMSHLMDIAILDKLMTE
jgi:hypothetical protein